MTESDKDRFIRGRDPVGAPPQGSGSALDAHRSKSMHDGVPVWCDCCSCEAESYWLQAMQETTIEPDRED